MTEPLELLPSQFREQTQPAVPLAAKGPINLLPPGFDTPDPATDGGYSPATKKAMDELVRKTTEGPAQGTAPHGLPDKPSPKKLGSTPNL